jgi:hypothetical protein
MEEGIVGLSHLEAHRAGNSIEWDEDELHLQGSEVPSAAAALSYA